MITKEQEEKFCKEMTKRLHWYEEVMEDPYRHFEWMYCDICEIFDVDAGDTCKKSGCPLYKCTGYRYKAMMDFDYRRTKNIKKHYNWLIKKIESAGYEYK